MDIKGRPNHRLYIQVLRKMSPEAKLRKAFELSDFTKQLFVHGLRKRFPDLSEEDFQRLLLERLEKCHNRNYQEGRPEHLRRLLDSMIVRAIMYR